jgi:3-dehydroquinate synthase
LGLPFVDLDVEVEQRAQASVGEIFDRDGEAGFRSIEAAELKVALQRPAHVLAVGGGALQEDENRRMVEAGGLVVTLTCSLSELVRRAKVEGEALRPVLFRATAGGPAGIDALAKLLSSRSWLYDAYPAVSSDGIEPETAAEHVATVYRRYHEGRFGAAYELPFPAGVSSEILFGQIPLDGEPGDLVAEGLSTAAVVSDATVSRIAGRRLAASLSARGIATTTVEIEPGEEAKSLATVEMIYGRFQAARLDRNAAVIGLGGGVVADVAGFAAATYLRGLRLVSIPTTLLAQVDASIGGKTGVDLGGVKNLVGSFHPAARVVIDTAFLRTLPEARLREGLAEMIKIAVVRDPGLLNHLEELESASEIVDRPDLIRRAARNKVDIVKADPYERTGQRALLNFGHTIGHAIETTSGFSWSHGECVAAGMVAEARLALARGLVDASTVERLARPLCRFGLPTEPPACDTEAMVRVMEQDKKRADGRIRVIMLRGVGDAELQPVSRKEIAGVIGTEAGIA